MTNDAKEQIRARLDIAEVVGEVVALKPAGRGQLKGLCPFHDEKTPSFHVHQERGFYYCFGCQAKGDVFDFVMSTRGVEFFESMQILGERAGVEVAPQAPGDRRRKDLFDVNKMALEWFRSNLEGPALDYLLGRGLTRESIDAFELGYAPEGWDGLLRHALTKGYRDDDLMEAGLLSENDRGRRYDRFRDRVMFPIKDALGRTVGFSGRVLGDAKPKYLNTPETPLFRKSELLYGLDLARADVRAEGACIVVEGYMDVIALHQVGIRNAVAALGATMTAEQAALLDRLEVRELYLAFDADEAGQRAILSGLEQSVGRRFLVRAVRVPHGKDPADAVLGGHVDEFRAALGQGLSEVEFRFRSVLARHDRSTLDGKRGILNDLLPALRPRDVFDPVATEMRRLAIDHLGVDPARLDDWIHQRTQRRLDATQVKGMQRERGGESQAALIELEIIALILLEPHRLRERVEYAVGCLPPSGGSLLREFGVICERCGWDDGAVLMAYRERDEGRIVFRRLLSRPDDEDEDERRLDVDAQLDKDLSRLRDLFLSAEKEGQRARLLERMQEVSAALTDPALPPERLAGLYAELKELNDMYKAREAERRMRVPASFHKARRTKSSF